MKPWLKAKNINVQWLCANPRSHSWFPKKNTNHWRDSMHLTVNWLQNLLVYQRTTGQVKDSTFLCWRLHAVSGFKKETTDASLVNNHTPWTLLWCKGHNLYETIYPWSELLEGHIDAPSVKDTMNDGFWSILVWANFSSHLSLCFRN